MAGGGAEGRAGAAEGHDMSDTPLRAVRIHALAVSLERFPHATHVLFTYGMTGVRMYPITEWECEEDGIEGWYEDLDGEPVLLAKYPRAVMWELVNREMLEVYEVPADEVSHPDPRDMDELPHVDRGYL